MSGTVVRSLTELAERLREEGALVAATGRAHILEIVTTFGTEAPLYVRWLPGRRAVHLTQPIPIHVEPEALGQAAAIVARLNLSMPTPALALDLDAGRIEYRVRLFADGDGGLDLDLCTQMIATIVGHVERLLPLLDECLRGEDADLDVLDAVASAPLPWLGYTE